MYTLIFVLLLTAVPAFFVYASSSVRAGIYLRLFCHRKTDRKVIALTFDDGPDPVQTPKILKVLRERHLPACFFCIGSKVKGHEELLRQIIKEGHAVGNHSFSHSACFPLYGFRRMCRDLTTCRQTLEKVTGCPVHWFRPPFGVTNPTLARAVRHLGYTPIGWNIRTLDTLQPAPEKIIRRIKKRLTPGSVLLLHDRMPHSDRLLVQILELLEEEGYRVVALEELLK